MRGKDRSQEGSQIQKAKHKDYNNTCWPTKQFLEDIEKQVCKLDG